MKGSNVTGYLEEAKAGPVKGSAFVFIARHINDHGRKKL